MNTVFTVTTGANTKDAKQYSVNLGQDCLEGVSEVSIREMADQSKRIKIQSPLRKLASAEAMQEHLQKTYPNATVSEGVIKEPSLNATAKALAAILTPEEMAEMIERKLAERNAS